MALTLPYRFIPPVLASGAAAALTMLLGAPPEAAIPAAFLAGLNLWLIGKPPIVDSPTIAAEIADPFEIARPLVERLMRTIDDPLLMIERQNVIIANQAAIDLLGGHVVGEDARLAIRHPAVADRLIGRRLATTNDTPVELAGLGAADKHWEVSIHDIDSNRRIVRLADRTSRYQTERMRVDFVANASHELRTPLATLIGFIETLQDGGAAEDAATRDRFLKIMSGEARRMQQLVDDLISLSRIEGTKFAPPGESVALAPLIAEVVTATREDRIETRVDDLITVRGDRAQLSQLLHNLIGNAIKYSRAGTAINVSVDRQGDDWVCIGVSDQGDGIAPEHLPRLTERFYRVDPGRSRAMGGTGLGLAIVKHIVERHRGKLEIRSEPGVGTRVEVVLPIGGGALSS